MSTHIKLEYHKDQTFRVILNRGKHTISGVSPSMIAVLLTQKEHNKVTLSKKEFELFKKNVGTVKISPKDREFLERMELLSR